MLNDVYNKRIIELAGNIPRIGWLEHPDASATAHSKLCGSTVVIDLKMRNGIVTDFAHDVKACALGQASSAIMAEHVVGATSDELRRVRETMLKMLKENGPPPEGRFADLKYLEPVRDYRARHASTMLTFDAVVDAIEIAGLRTLALVNDGAAVAVNYAMTRAFPAPEFHVVFDAGASALRATVVEFAPVPDPKAKSGAVRDATQITVHGVGFDRHTGGAELDRRMRDLMLADFQRRHKRDISGDRRAMAKLWKEAGRVKAILSANSEAQATVMTAVEAVRAHAPAVRGTVGIGLEAEEILDFTSRHGVNLIVMGMHGHGRTARWLRGSVTDQVLGGAGITIPADQSVLGKEIKIDPQTGDTSAKDLTIEVIKDNKETFFKSQSIS